MKVNKEIEPRCVSISWSPPLYRDELFKHDLQISWYNSDSPPIWTAGFLISLNSVKTVPIFHAPPPPLQYDQSPYSRCPRLVNYNVAGGPEIKKERKQRNYTKTCINFSVSHCAIMTYSTTIYKLIDIISVNQIAEFLIISVLKPCIYIWSWILYCCPAAAIWSKPLFMPCALPLAS